MLDGMCSGIGVPDGGGTSDQENAAIIEVKQVGRRPISFELKALLIKAWHDLTYEGTVTELRDHWAEFQRYGYDEIPSDWRAMRLIPVS